MIEVEMSDDIRKFETKFLGPFTMRQTVCTAIALLYAVPIAALINVSIDNKVLIGFILAAPALGCGFIKFGGMPLEVFFIRVFYMYFLTPSKRKCKSVNTYKATLREMKKEKEIFIVKNWMTQKI